MDPDVDPSQPPGRTTAPDGSLLQAVRAKKESRRTSENGMLGHCTRHQKQLMFLCWRTRKKTFKYDSTLRKINSGTCIPARFATLCISDRSAERPLRRIDIIGNFRDNCLEGRQLRERASSQRQPGGIWTSWGTEERRSLFMASAVKTSRSHKEGDKRFPKEIPKGEVPSAIKKCFSWGKVKSQHDITSFSTNSHAFTFRPLSLL